MALDWLNRGTQAAQQGLSRLGFDPTGLAGSVQSVGTIPDMQMPGRLGFDPTGIRQSGASRAGIGNLSVDPTGLRGSRRGFDLGMVPGSFNEAFDSMQGYLMREYGDQFTAQPGMGTTPGATGSMASLGGDWSGVDQWNQHIAAASNQYGVPANLIKAIMRVESEGNPGATGAPGVVGVMQVHTGVWGNGPWAYDTGANIMKGTEILKGNYDNYGSWDMAIRAYLGFGTDMLGTTDQAYLQRVTQYWSELNAMGTSPGGIGAGLPGGGMGSFAAITGGGNYPVSQEYGLTSFAQGSGRSMYGYTTEYTVGGVYGGHVGVDIGTPYGTALYAPVNGTVVCAATGRGTGEDSCSAYTDSGGGSGRIQIKLDNGDMLILGHTSRSNVQPGQRVSAGALVGYSGNLNGDHVHVEYRQWAPGQTRSNYLAVDPRQALGGGFAGTMAPAMGSGSGASSVYGGYSDMNDLMNAYMTGQFTPTWQRAW